MAIVRARRSAVSCVASWGQTPSPRSCSSLVRGGFWGSAWGPSRSAAHPLEPLGLGARGRGK
eukprot:761529-Lingulodinium_polyedra.AAC.1